MKLSAVLAEMRRAETMPWDRRLQRYHQLVFPQMARALPSNEAAQYRLAFEVELDGAAGGLTSIRCPQKL